MGLRFRKSIKIAPGVKLNFNKKSTGVTFGGKGFNYTVNSKGKRTTSVGVPGTGLYYTTSNTKSEKSKKRATKDIESSQTLRADNFNEKENNMASGKWYKKTWGIILMLVLFFPVGLYLMCRYAKWNKGVKIAIIAFFLALLLFSSSTDNENQFPNDEQQNTDVAVISTETTTESTTKETTTKETTTKETTTKKTTTTETTTTEITTTETTTEETTTEATTEETTEAEAEYEEDYYVEEDGYHGAGDSYYVEDDVHYEENDTYYEEDTYNEESEMVWIPNSGKKYHSYEGCSNMKNPSCVTVEEAENWGYSACSKCY